MKIIGLIVENLILQHLVINGKVVYAVQEERITREKFTKNFHIIVLKNVLNLQI